MVDPDEFSRDGLGENWSGGVDGAYNYFKTVAFNLSDYSITCSYCEAIK